jgi:hypothetical protein
MKFDKENAKMHYRFALLMVFSRFEGSLLEYTEAYPDDSAAIALLDRISYIRLGLERDLELTTDTEEEE